MDPYRVAPTAKSARPPSTRPFTSSARASAAGGSSAVPHLSVHIAASSSGKGRKFQAEKNTFDYDRDKDGREGAGLGVQKGGTLREKRMGRPDSGQDAYFVSKVGEEGKETSFAIADGVGGWTEHGLDPADFSHGLCGHMGNVSRGWDGGRGRFGPRELLRLGYEATISDEEIVGGGTTACVGVVDGEGRLRMANLGDSGFLLLRLGTVQNYSSPQTHAFNTPFQMSLTPEAIAKQASMFGGMPLSDQPEKADVSEHELRNGDVLVLATDGVWDNLDAQDVLKIVSKIMRESGAWKLDQSEGYQVAEKIRELVKKEQTEKYQVQRTLQAVLAAGIVREAKTASMNERRDGPFAKAVHKEYPMEQWHGGKVDDIAVLVVLAVGGGQGRVKAKL